MTAARRSRFPALTWSRKTGATSSKDGREAVAPPPAGLRPAHCEAVYVKEYRVVVKLFNITETYWVEEGAAKMCGLSRGRA